MSVTALEAMARHEERLRTGPFCDSCRLPMSKALWDLGARTHPALPCSVGEGPSAGEVAAGRVLMVRFVPAQRVQDSESDTLSSRMSCDGQLKMNGPATACDESPDLDRLQPLSEGDDPMTDVSAHRYGEPPVDLGPLDLPDWTEFMHWLYLPVMIPEVPGRVSLPMSLQFLHEPVGRAIADAFHVSDDALTLDERHVYLTARRGYATPGNPLNRPGWHCDDFGGTDLNYIWSDRYPTRLLRSFAPLPIPEDDARSMVVMADLATPEAVDYGQWLEDAPVGHLLRLSPFVIHDTPLIPAPGGMRSFFKISVSTHRYNLIGNSHNHQLEYDWPMVDRAELRNQPHGNRDYAGQPA